MGAFPLVGVEMSKLPPIVKSTDKIGNGLLSEAAEKMGLNVGTPVFGGCDDVQAAVIGSGKNMEGDVHIYLGTSAWVAACSKSATKFMHGAAAIQSADPEMNLIAGITEAAGSNIQWISDQFFSHEKKELGDGIYAYMDEVIRTIPAGSDHLICTPWMMGERCPVSSTTTRCTLFNVNPEHTREHMMRAVYEGVAYNLRWILENYQKDYGFKGHNFNIIGGGALDDAWMQIIADVTGAEFSIVENPRNAGALGAAIIALIGLGELKGFDKAKDFVRISKTYKPNNDNKAIYDEMFATYQNLYYGLKKTYKKANGKRFGGEK
jgi:Sugar (pentulose and hexulose) kinases